MPTYNYKCDNCDIRFTVRQSMKDDPLTTCENCSGQIRRVISGHTGLIFKGSGFYITDYARKSEDNPKKKNVKEKETDKTKKTDTEKPKTDPKKTDKQKK